jgi:hypothetical protein
MVGQFRKSGDQGRVRQDRGKKGRENRTKDKGCCSIRRRLEKVRVSW